ncbi:hypothetical protein G7085_10700 [Tessaracoccus sp. HDW20]|uniref:hypothetical protein n=1 Tax=Tessaracoccus coleopterorum TaxID=2714950 RepID=UPI0018D2B9F3|nr:hypothetical protein [Tessaracoccus coleopterorum]NHB84920.1 hypothetical protein [Tessaracoccus coleopterorum]
MNITHPSHVHLTSSDTTIVLPEPSHLPWRDRIALRASLWLLERATRPAQDHLEHRLERHAAEQVQRRELASLSWLPPR